MADDKKRYLKVEGHSYLVRDTMSNAIINQNQAEYNQYKQLRKIKDKEQERLDKLENDLGELKDLLRQLLDKGQ
jgi:hypothetical protein|tara:strand:+ start:527 stop:748 length:222 start_codon:yes stop_codon:yes gene_type:complete